MKLLFERKLYETLSLQHPRKLHVLDILVFPREHVTSHVSFAVALLAKTIISSTGEKLSETSKMEVLD